MQFLLGDFATVRTGLTIRGRGASRLSAKRGLPLLRISEISPSGKIRIESPHLIDPELSRVYDFRLKTGDVIVANRGSRMTAAYVPSNVDAIAGGQFFIIKTKETSVLPEYLVWYINQRHVQERLKAESYGSYVSTLPIDSIRRLKVPIPNLATQRKIVDLQKLGEEEEKLTDQIRQLRQKYLEAILFKMASGNPR